jgi:hypothetical protein
MNDLSPEQRVKEVILALCAVIETMIGSQKYICTEIERVVDLKKEETLRSMLGKEQGLHDQAAATIENVRREFQ